MQVFVAADHAGFALKEKVAQFVRDELGYEVIDCGATELVPGDDYPGIMARAAKKLSEAVVDGKEVRALLFGKSGQGEAMVANRFSGVRAAVYYGGNEEIVALSREHNDANALALGAGFLSEEEAKQVVRVWLATPFSGEERHPRRVQEIETETHGSA